ncbi:MAG: ATP-binding protein [Candidatus Saccharibacteria bacterium]
MEISVQIASRYKRRKAANAVGKSLLKTLTEPITNADDSYKRLVDNGLINSEEKKPIIIELDKTSRSVKVIDFGEGMTDESMQKFFGVYGDDTSGGSQGSGVRGMFGQGISDVLFHHENGMILSIVDRTLYTCKFKKSEDGDWKIDPKRTTTQLKPEVRKGLGIPEGNGTIVSFTLAEGTPIPHKFTEQLRDFYMLRLINSDPSRSVILREKKRSGTTEEEIRYVSPDGEKIGAWHETIEFEDYEPVEVSIELYKSKEALAEQQNGLLVYDEKNAVYDLTLFGYPQDYPGAEELYGTVELTGARAIIYDKINQEQPEEILTDERSGFNTDHEFYKKLQAVVKPKLDDILLAKSSAKAPAKEQTDPKHQKVLALFDNLYREVMGADNLIASPKADPTPPEGGLQFDRTNINTTVNKSYGLGLNINLALLPVGSVVNLECDKEDIVIEPRIFEVTESLKKANKLARKIITIQGKKSGISASIEASTDVYKANVVATVVDEDRVYPEFLQFYPLELAVTQEASHKAFLYINTNEIAPGSTIYISSDNENVKLSDDSVIVSSDFEYDDIVKQEIAFSTLEKCTASITAIAIDFGEQAQVTVSVVDPKDPKPTKSTSKFKDWMFYPDLGIYQCFYSSIPTDPNYGMLLVNSTHPLNQRYFGMDPTKNSIADSLVAQVYLAEVLTNEILNFIFTEKQQVEQTSGGDPNAVRDPHNYIRNEIAKMKRSIGLQAQEMWVDQKKLDELTTNPK